MGADKQALMKQAEVQMKDAERQMKRAEEKLAQDEDKHHQSSKEYFEEATNAGAKAKKAQDASKSVADAKDNLKTMQFGSGAAPETPSVLARVSSILRDSFALLDFNVGNQVRELSPSE